MAEIKGTVSTARGISGKVAMPYNVTEGSTVSVNPVLNAGTKVAEITVDGTKKTLYAPKDLSAELATTNEKIQRIEEQLAQGGTATGFTPQFKAALSAFMDGVAYVGTNGQALKQAVLNAMTVSGGGSEDIPVTLIGISAVYNGDAVAEGTDASEIDGIVVTAHYSDGSSMPVYGWTISGTVAVGENVCTISYESMTTTVSITGIASLWYVSGQPLTDLVWEPGSYDNITGEIEDPSNDWAYHADIRCDGVDYFTLTNIYSNYGVAFLDENKNKLGFYGNSNVMPYTPFVIGETATIPVYARAKYMRIEARKANYQRVVVTPYEVKTVTSLNDVSVGEIYSVPFEVGAIDQNNGTEYDIAEFIRTDYVDVGDATVINLCHKTRSWVIFYDADKDYMSTGNPQSKGYVDVPQDAKYFRYTPNGTDTLYSVFSR